MTIENLETLGYATLLALAGAGLVSFVVMLALIVRGCVIARRPAK